ncbi:MAG: hypothetical protein E7470_06350 [Ruminococcaceae bacterium]|nr:hypothetical protein [Oscillospiraceae bacterium]
MKNKFNEWWSTERAKNPGKIVLGVILLFNIAFFLLSAAVISALSLDGTEHMGFLEAAFCTLTMILDAGCIQFVIADIGESGVFISVFCLCVVLIGMISFTGAVIGYVTNYISHFIENANAGKHKIFLSNHIVILNWNSRATEIINDYLYSGKGQKIVVLVSARKDEVQKEIDERIADTIARENRKLSAEFAGLPYIKRIIAIRKHKFRRNVTVIVREGDVFSTKQLQDISLEKARSIIILGNDINNTICKFEHQDWLDKKSRGNPQTIKTLMQVADITSAASSADNQKIIVEVTDDATWELIDKIIKNKEVAGKCDIVPVRVNQVLGQILSQFSLMPELNKVYEEVFSNRGVEIYTVEQAYQPIAAFAKQYLSTHLSAIPLSYMKHKGVEHCFYLADEPEDLTAPGVPAESDYAVDLNRGYWIEHKNVIILGHNSKSRDIMRGFVSFCNEWNRGDESILNIVVIDDPQNLEKMKYYADYPFVKKTVAADIFDEELICSTIEEFVSQNDEDTSILILSDDSVLNEDIDSNALAHLIYVQEIINRKKLEPDYDPGKIDVVVEIIDPKHHDIVNSYSVNNVVISNRYISKMIAQIGEVDALFDFYVDILSYDDGKVGDRYESKEIYVKKVQRYFNTLPDPCNAAELIRGVLSATIDEQLPEEEQDPTLVLGYVSADGKVTLFGGNQEQIPVALTEKDKIIVFSTH